MPIPSFRTDPNALGNYVQGLIDDGVLTHDQILAETLKHWTTLSDITPTEAANPNNQRALDGMLKVLEVPRPGLEASWGEDPTDCDRLNDVLAALRCDGILVRDYYQCCDDCDKPECIVKVREAARAAKCEGFLVCFRQDVQECRRSDILVFNYGAPDNDSSQALQVGQKIVQALTSAGFDVQQDGGQLNQIRLVGFIWQRRRYTIAS
jgi:hypothetical protein